MALKGVRWKKDKKWDEDVKVKQNKSALRWQLGQATTHQHPRGTWLTVSRSALFLMSPAF